MRIDSYIQVNQLYNTNKTKAGKKTESASVKDSLEISDFGSAYQVAKQAVAEGTDVREDRIRQIKEQMTAGTYKVSIEDVAEKMADALLR